MKALYLYQAALFRKTTLLSAMNAWAGEANTKGQLAVLLAQLQVQILATVETVRVLVP